MGQHTKNNHYIPKALIRRFSSESGERFYCEKGIVGKKDAKKIFSASEIYDDKLEKDFNLNESKLKGVLEENDERLKIKICVLLREMSIPEWNIQIYDSKDNEEAVNILNTFFIRMNLKFYSANTNKDQRETAFARDASVTGNLKGSDNIVFIRYNFNFCPFVLPVNIPVLLPVGMNIVFATPISKDILMLHYCNKITLGNFIKKYRFKHQINLSMVYTNTPSGQVLCNFVCSAAEILILCGFASLSL